MISLKTGRNVEAMRRAGRITAAARALAGEMVKPGASTKAIDKAVHDFIVSQGAKPSFLHYQGYPASICASVNEQVIHGIPGARKIREGDIVSIDVGAFIDRHLHLRKDQIRNRWYIRQHRPIWHLLFFRLYQGPEQ